ncbi:MAG: hypothetical protein ACP5RW_04795 [bacterium]
MESKPIRLLICDDHPLICDGIIRLLEGEKDVVVVGKAYNGQQKLLISDCKGLKNEKFSF